MTPVEYEFLCRFLKERSGLALGPNKEYLVQSRLGPIVRSSKLSSLSEMIARLRNGSDHDMAEMVTEAMTTNESFFFRDKTPFDLLREHVLPEIIKASRGPRRLRIWCAAASTGQEPYSVAITLKEMAAELRGWSTEIVATDISKAVLDRAKAGVYTQFEVQRGLPIKQLLAYFRKTDDMWELDPGLRAMVRFEMLNLLKDFSRLGQFDIVFCRNVLIYFDEATKRDVLRRIAQRTQAGGYLMLGAAETIMGLNDQFKTVPGKQGLCALATGSAGAVAPAPVAALRASSA
jgi:chemotaxis protein methyltransferase CheR